MGHVLKTRHSETDFIRTAGTEDEYNWPESEQTLEEHRPHNREE
jgi:hypothetical protein